MWCIQDRINKEDKKIENNTLKRWVGNDFLHKRHESLFCVKTIW
jgi:hypothetical protein